MNKFNKLKHLLVFSFTIIMGTIYIITTKFDNYTINKTSHNNNQTSLQNIKISTDTNISNNIKSKEIIQTQYIETDIVEPKTNKKININTSTIEELKTLPGISEQIAKSIIEYRTKYGNFTSIEQIKNIKRIGDKTFDKIKNFININ